MTAKRKSGVVIKNKRAAFEYELLDTYTAGIVLVGTEIKSIRAGRVSLSDAYCYFVGRELYVKNMSIADYDYGSYNRHEPERDRKLLLNKRELSKLFRATREKGFTIVVTRLFISDNGYAKLNIALARGKRQYDKRHSIKDKDMQREQDRMARM